MTWGQLRFQLNTSAPGISADLLDEFLNVRYEQVLEATNWQGAKARATIQTIAAYQSTTDTVTFTVGSAAIVGLGTTWVTGQTGRVIYRPGDTVVYTFTYVSGTTATLDRLYEGNGIDAAGTVYAGSAYVVMQDIYSLPADLGEVVAALDPTTGYPLNKMSIAEMEASCGPRTLIQTPQSYALYDDTSENSPPVLHQLRFYPPPLNARGIPVEYTRAANAFDGGNTSAAPLPFVSSTVLLEGCRADIQLYLASQSEGGAAAAHARAAEGYELKFTRELNRLLLVEHAQRRKIGKMQMADRFTRHRLERATRGRNNNWGPGQGGPY